MSFWRFSKWYGEESILLGTQWCSIIPAEGFTWCSKNAALHLRFSTCFRGTVLNSAQGQFTSFT